MENLHRLGVAAGEADLPQLRRDLRDWATGAGLTPDQVEDLTLASYEIFTNVAEHAYPAGVAGTFDLEAATTDTHVDVSVRDRGTWQTPVPDTSRTSLRGRGLLLARSVANDVRVEPGPSGTTVHLRWMLP